MGSCCRWCRQLAKFAICHEEVRLTKIWIIGFLLRSIRLILTNLWASSGPYQRLPYESIKSQYTGFHTVSASVNPVLPHLQHLTLICTNCGFKSTKSKKLSISSLSSHSCSHVFSVMELYSEIGGYWSHSLEQMSVVLGHSSPKVITKYYLASKHKERMRQEAWEAGMKGLEALLQIRENKIEKSIIIN